MYSRLYPDDVHCGLCSLAYYRRPGSIVSTVSSLAMVARKIDPAYFYTIVCIVHKGSSFQRRCGRVIHKCDFSKQIVFSPLCLVLNKKFTENQLMCSLKSIFC